MLAVFSIHSVFSWICPSAHWLPPPPVHDSTYPPNPGDSPSSVFFTATIFFLCHTASRWQKLWFLIYTWINYANRGQVYMGRVPNNAGRSVCVCVGGSLRRCSPENVCAYPLFFLMAHAENRVAFRAASRSARWPWVVFDQGGTAAFEQRNLFWSFRRLLGTQTHPHGCMWLSTLNTPPHFPSAPYNLQIFSTSRAGGPPTGQARPLQPLVPLEVHPYNFCQQQSLHFD